MALCRLLVFVLEGLHLAGTLCMLFVCLLECVVLFAVVCLFLIVWDLLILFNSVDFNLWLLCVTCYALWLFELLFRLEFALLLSLL